MIDQTEYNRLKDVFKVEANSHSLFNYLLDNTELVKNKVFHQLNKEELIKLYKELTEKHLKLLENLRFYLLNLDFLFTFTL